MGTWGAQAHSPNWKEEDLGSGRLTLQAMEFRRLRIWCLQLEFRGKGVWGIHTTAIPWVKVRRVGRPHGARWPPMGKWTSWGSSEIENPERGGRLCWNYEKGSGNCQSWKTGGEEEREDRRPQVGNCSEERVVLRRPQWGFIEGLGKACGVRNNEEVQARKRAHHDVMEGSADCENGTLADE